jgi:PAS domain S-box-containing protein
MVISFFIARLETHYALLLISYLSFFTGLSYLITAQRVLMYKKIVRNEELLNQIMNSSGDAILLFDAYEKKILKANQRAVDMLKVKDLGQLTEKKINDIFADHQYLKSHLSQIKKVGKEQKLYEDEVLLKRHDGSVFWGKIIISSIESGYRTIYILQIHDITNRKKNEEEIKRLVSLYELILNNIDEFIYITKYKDGKPHLEYVSPYIQKLFNIDEKTFRSESFRKNYMPHIYHPEDLENMKKTAKRFRETKQKVEMVYRMKPVGGDRYIKVQETLIPLTDQEGNLIHSIGIVRIKNE